MNILISTLKEELATVKRLENKYSKELSKLPKGSFILRKVKGKNYGYLTYRDGSKVKQKYLGRLNDADIEKYQNIKKRRKELKEKLKSVKKQRTILERALKNETK